jgi:hypothetical protein
MSEPRTPRVFRYLDIKSGTFQLTPFPDDAPDDINDLMRRTRHITEIECFANLGYKLALDIGEEELADQVQNVGLDWEHTVANHNELLVPGDPTKVSLPEIQAIVDALDQATEDLVAKVNALSASRPNATRRIEQEMQERREEK